MGDLRRRGVLRHPVLRTGLRTNGAWRHYELRGGSCGLEGLCQPRLGTGGGVAVDDPVRGGTVERGLRGAYGFLRVRRTVGDRVTRVAHAACCVGAYRPVLSR